MHWNRNFSKFWRVFNRARLRKFEKMLIFKKVSLGRDCISWFFLLKFSKLSMERVCKKLKIFRANIQIHKIVITAQLHLNSNLQKFWKFSNRARLPKFEKKFFSIFKKIFKFHEISFRAQLHFRKKSIKSISSPYHLIIPQFFPDSLGRLPCRHLWLYYHCRRLGNDYFGIFWQVFFRGSLSVISYQLSINFRKSKLSMDRSKWHMIEWYSISWRVCRWLGGTDKKWW